MGETWAIAAMMAAAVAAMGPDRTDRDDPGGLTGQTTVVLDFQGRSVSEVVEAIAGRSGKRVVAINTVAMPIGAFPRIGVPDDQGWRARTVTLEAAGPVPFWEAIDRLAEEGRLAYRLGSFGDTGDESSGVVFEGPGDAPGPACYAGPFRVGLRGIHEWREVVLVRGPWVRFFPSKFAIPAVGDDLISAPDDGGPLYVELDVAAEPGLICRRDGPLAELEAVDDDGRSLLAPGREDARRAVQVFASIDGGIAPILRIPLERAAGPGASRTIARLRGVIPVEVAVLREDPAVVIPLGDAEGETARGGGTAFTVEEDRTDPEGRRRITVSCRLTGEMSQELRSAWLASLRTFQLRMVDSRGEAVSCSSGSGGDGNGGLTFSYEYTPGRPGSGPPAEFRYYDLDRTSRRIPFEFRDVPLP